MAKAKTSSLSKLEKPILPSQKNRAHEEKETVFPQLPEQRISLRQLVDGIYHPPVLGEAIAAYGKLLHSTQGYQCTSIVPILETRAEALEAAFAATVEMQPLAIQKIRSLTVSAIEIMSIIASLNAKTNTADIDTGISKATKKLFTDFTGIHTGIRTLHEKFMEDSFEEASLNAQSLHGKYVQLHGALKDDIGLKEWVKKQVEADREQLMEHAVAISLAPTKNATQSVYQNVSSFYAEAVEWMAVLQKKKSMNPLISALLITEATLFMDKATEFFQKLNVWTSLLYKYDQERQTVENHIKCMNMLAEKIIL